MLHTYYEQETIFLLLSCYMQCLHITKLLLCKNNKEDSHMKSIYDCSNVLTRLGETEEGRNSFGRNNKAFARGRLNGNLKVTHVLNETLYETKLVVKTVDDKINYLPLVMSSNYIDEEVLKSSLDGRLIDAIGEFRTALIDGHKKVFLYAKKINVGEDKIFIQGKKDYDLIFLKGSICKPPVYRTCTNSDRVRTQFEVAVKRRELGVDYIPCTAWSEEAEWVKDQTVGTEVWLYGMMKSRLYKKKVEGELEETMEAFEVVVLEIDTATW